MTSLGVPGMLNLVAEWGFYEVQTFIAGMMSVNELAAGACMLNIDLIVGLTNVGIV